MATPVHLLVVDDDPEVRDVLRRYFTGQAFRVSTATDGASARAVLAQSPVEAILLDLGLPGEDGFELTRELRRNWNGALIIVTGRGESVDRIVGLELGADDYVTKPFNLRELLARVRSALRRSTGHAAMTRGDAGEPLYQFAGFRLDPAARVLHDAKGTPVDLTTGEYELLQVLIQSPHRVLSRDELMDRTRHRPAAPYDRAIDMQIRRLRHKIEADPAHPELIKSVRGAGYLFAAQVTRPAAA
ncbi:MAG: response regulator transcription factor [Rhodanobacteraceae bacterium]|nr:MAG: response regulator transcription factor [Rhodanobacteraceae bacterium]